MLLFLQPPCPGPSDTDQTLMLHTLQQGHTCLWQRTRVHSVSTTVEWSPQGEAYPKRLQVLPSASTGQPGRRQARTAGRWGRPCQAVSYGLGESGHQGSTVPAHGAGAPAAPSARPGQAPTQPGEEQAASTPLGPSQPASTSSQMVGLPSPTWVQSDVPEGAPGPLQLLPFTHAGQQPVQYHSSPPAGAAGWAAIGTSIPRASTGQPWAIPASTGVPTLPVTEGLTPAQVPAPLRGKIQQGEYVDLSELLAYDFQYRYSGLDDSQALEVIDSKLSLAPRQKARHLSNLQLWL